MDFKCCPFCGSDKVKLLIDVYETPEGADESDDGSLVEGKVLCLICGALGPETHAGFKLGDQAKYNAIATQAIKSYLLWNNPRFIKNNNS